MTKLELQNTSTIKFLLNSISKKRLLHLLVIAFITSVLDIIGIALIFPFIKVITDKNFVIKIGFTDHWLGLAPHQSFVLMVGFLMIFFYILKSICQSKLLQQQAKHLSTFTAETTNKIVSNILHTNYSTFQTTAASEISGIAYSNTVHSSLAMSALIQAINEAFLLGLLIMGFFWLNPKLAIGSLLVILLVSIALYFLVVKVSTKLGQRQTAIENNRYKLLFSITSAIRDIKIMGLEKLFDEKSREISSNYSDIAWRFNHTTTLPRIIIEFTALFAVVFIAMLIILTKTTTEDAAPILGVLAVATVRAVPAFAKLISSISNYKFSSRFVKNLIELKERLENNFTPKHIDQFVFEKCIRLSNVYFNYSDKTILNNVSMSISKGDAIAIVGPSGAGKSTLLDIITGLQRPSSGEFLCDTKSFTPYNSLSMQRLIGYVSQNITLLDDTISYNITFQSNPDIQKLQEAIHKACLNELISDLPDGLLTKVGENGLRLSGGQRQRIGIARALYKTPSILIFDEATSALDPVSENTLVNEIANLKGKITTIMVTHKLSTAAFCDRIYVLNKGSIISVGSHEELMKKCELYQHMSSLQQNSL